MSLIFNSIIKIYGRKRLDETTFSLKGIGFVIKQDNTFTYILTCNHVVYLSKDSIKYNIKINNDLDVNPELITYGHEIENFPVDLAILKVENLHETTTISLQKDISDTCKLSLNTFSKVDNDALTFDPKSISLAYKKPEPLDYCHNTSDAYLFHSESLIEGGYSGSPILDEETGKVIAILNISREEGTQECKGLAMSNVVKIFPEIEDELESIKEKNSKITIMVKSNNSTNYTFIINNDDTTFSEVDIINVVKQKEVIDYIYSLIGRKRNQIVEFFLPFNLFKENIHLWENSNGKKLTEKVSIYFRFLSLSEISEELKKDWEDKWKEDYEKHEIDLFEKTVTPIHKGKNIHPTVVSAVCNSDIEFDEKDFEELEFNYISIAIWESECKNQKKYDLLLSKIKKENFKKFPELFKNKIFESKNSEKEEEHYSSNACLLWDNPFDLPKKDLNNA